MDTVLCVGGFSRKIISGIPSAFACKNILKPSRAISFYSRHNESLAAVLMSLRMKDMDGVRAMEEMHRINPDVPVIISTHDVRVPVIVEAMQRGAYDYLHEPEIRTRYFPHLLERAASHARAMRENKRLHAMIGGGREGAEFVGTSEGARGVLANLRRIADSDVPVLITGESGTGKEVAARMVHQFSRRIEKPFVAVNCAALSPQLLEAELFGYRKGAFTGATADHEGLFEQADKGILFLDEIGATNMDFQIKLLRVIEDGEVRKVGGVKSRSVDVRIVAATNARLDRSIAAGTFRRDLYFRLNVVPIEIPALRERREDIPVLAHYFLTGLQREYSRKIRGISKPALKRLEEYSWPGNVRELRNAMERAVLLGDRDMIRPRDLPDKIRDWGMREVRTGLREKLTDTLRETQKSMIQRALEQSGGNKAKAARELGIKRTTLLAKMARLGLDDLRRCQSPWNRRFSL